MSIRVKELRQKLEELESMGYKDYTVMTAPKKSSLERGQNAFYVKDEELQLSHNYRIACLSTE